MKDEYTYKVTWVTESMDGIDRGEKEFKTSISAYAFADSIKKKREFFEDFIIRKLEFTIINTYSLI